MENKILKAGAWNVAGIFFVKGSGVLFSFYFASVLTREEFGEVSAFLSYAALLSVILGLNLSASMNNAKIEFADDYRGYASSVLTFSVINFAVIGTAAMIFIKPLSRILQLSTVNCVLLIFYSFGIYLLLYYQAYNITQYKYKNSIFISLFNIFAAFILSVILINTMKDNRVLAKNLGGTLPLVAIGIFVIVSIFVSGKKLINTRYWKYALKISAPNITHTLSQDILAQSDRIFIKHICGAADTGIYSLIYYFGLCMNLLWSGINGVWVPWLFSRLAEGDTVKILKNSRKYILFFSAVTVLMCVSVPPFIKSVMPPDYAAGVAIVTPIILSGYFMCMYSFVANLEFYHKKNGYIALGTACAAIINIILNLIFIGHYGFVAAAYTTLASYILLFVFHYIVATFILKINIYKLRDFLPYIALTCILSFAI